jgi:hypothetical protein
MCGKGRRRRRRRRRRRGTMLQVYTYIKLLVIDLQHRSIDTSTKTFDLCQSKHLIFCGLVAVDSEMILNSGTNFFCTTELAWSGTTQLEMIFTNRSAVEHGVESSHLIYTHWRHIKCLCNLVHGSQRYPVVILFLYQVQQRHYSTLFVVGRIFLQQFFNFLLVLSSELEFAISWVVFRYTMLNNIMTTTYNCSSTQVTSLDELKETASTCTCGKYNTRGTDKDACR